MMPLHTRIIQVALLILGLSSGVAFAEPEDAGLPQLELPYSFVEAPYIHPKIVQDLTTWVSDQGDQVVAINLSDSQESNRYFGEVEVRVSEMPHPFVYFQEPNLRFGYEYVGQTKSGLHILYTSEWGGGSGVFKGLLLVTFEHDEGIEVDWDGSVIRSGEQRVLLRKRGEIALGDRWDGTLRVEGDHLFVGKDEGWFTSSGGKGGGWLSYDRKDRTLDIEVGRE
jgi:hypothetical protein